MYSIVYTCIVLYTIFKMKHYLNSLKEIDKYIITHSLKQY